MLFNVLDFEVLMQSVGSCPYRFLYTHPKEALTLGSLCAGMLVLPIPTVAKVIAVASIILLSAIAYSIAYAYGRKKVQEERMELEAAESAYRETINRQATDMEDFRRKFQEMSISFREQNAALRDARELVEAHLLVRSIVLSCGLPYRATAHVVNLDSFNAYDKDLSETHHRLWQTIEYDLHKYPYLNTDLNITLATLNETHQARKVHHEKVGQQVGAFLDISKNIIASRWEYLSNLSV